MGHISVYLGCIFFGFPCHPPLRFFSKFFFYNILQGIQLGVGVCMRHSNKILLFIFVKYLYLMIFNLQIVFSECLHNIPSIWARWLQIWHVRNMTCVCFCAPFFLKYVSPSVNKAKHSEYCDGYSPPFFFSSQRRDRNIFTLPPHATHYVVFVLKATRTTKKPKQAF